MVVRFRKIAKTAERCQMNLEGVLLRTGGHQVTIPEMGGRERHAQTMGNLVFVRGVTIHNRKNRRQWETGEDYQGGTYRRHEKGTK